MNEKRCPKCNSDVVCSGKIIWMSEAFKDLNETQPIDYHCLNCGFEWR